MKKKIYKKIYKYLSLKGSLFNERIDYLRVGVNELNSQIYNIFKKNIEDNIGGFNMNIAGMDFLVIKTKTNLGKVVYLSTSININGVDIMITSARILELRNNMRKGNKYLIDIYGQTFRLLELINFDLNKFINSLSDNQKFIKRIDYASDFIVEDAEATIKRVDRNTNKVKKINYLNESIAIGLYDKKGRDNGKVKYNLTKRLGIRIYNKVKNILDLGYGAFYQEYLSYNIIRLEAMVGSEISHRISFGEIQNMKAQVIELLLGFKPLYNHNDKIKNNSITAKYLGKMSSDIGSRLWTYIMNGGDIKKIKLGPDSISLFELLNKIENNNDDEILF